MAQRSKKDPWWARLRVGEGTCPYCFCRDYAPSRRLGELEIRLARIGFRAVKCRKCEFPYYRWAMRPLIKALRRTSASVEVRETVADKNLSLEIPAEIPRAVPIPEPSPQVSRSTISGNPRPTTPAASWREVPSTPEGSDGIASSVEPSISSLGDARDPEPGRASGGLFGKVALGSCALVIVALGLWTSSLARQSSDLRAELVKQQMKARIQSTSARARLAMRAMESANRGFLLTGDPEFRSSFNPERDKLSASYKELLQLTEGRPAQQEDLRKIKAKVTLWFQLYNPMILEYRDRANYQSDQAVLNRCKLIQEEILTDLERVF